MSTHTKIGDSAHCIAFSAHHPLIPITKNTAPSTTFERAFIGVELYGKRPGGVELHFDEGLAWRHRVAKSICAILTPQLKFKPGYY